MSDIPDLNNTSKKDRMTAEEINVRVKAIIVSCLALTLMGIVFVVLYSIMFVTQPLDAISPIDTKFFELIIPIATFLTGTLSGFILSGKEHSKKQCKMCED
jgi:hypothetical protein